MISEAKAIKIINKYLQCAQDPNVRKYFPLEASRIYSDDDQLCDLLIDFLGDIYIYSGMDENYEDNERGSEIQEAITFLSFYNGNVLH